MKFSPLSFINNFLVILPFVVFLPSTTNADDSDSDAATVMRKPEPIPEELIDQVVAINNDNSPSSSSFSPRGTVSCELFELKIQEDRLALTVWNNMDLHDCPSDWLSEIDRTKYYVGGPRWRTQDSFGLATTNEGRLVIPSSILQQREDSTNNTVSDTTSAGGSSPSPQEIPPGLGLPMVDAATVVLMPVPVLQERLPAGIMGSSGNITSIEDLPAPVHQMILKGIGSGNLIGALSGGSGGGDDGNDDNDNDVGGFYKITTVDRKFQTLFRFKANKPIYTLSDGTCAYAMKYRSAEINPAMAGDDEEEVLSNLGSLYQHLPANITYKVLRFDTDQYILDSDRVQYVMSDEFANSFDLFVCGNHDGNAGAKDDALDGEEEDQSSSGGGKTIHARLVLVTSLLVAGLGFMA